MNHFSHHRFAAINTSIIFIYIIKLDSYHNTVARCRIIPLDNCQ